MISVEPEPGLNPEFSAFPAVAVTALVCPLPPPSIHSKGFSSIVSGSITVTHMWPLHGTNPILVNNNQ